MRYVASCAPSILARSKYRSRGEGTEMAQIVIAEEAGACYGVERALELVLSASENVEGPLHTLGPLIHNPLVVHDLEERLSDEVSDLEKTRSSQQKAVDELQTQVDEYEVKVAEARNYYDALDAQVQAELAAQQQAEEEANMKAAMEAIEEQQAIEQRSETSQNNNDNSNSNAGQQTDNKKEESNQQQDEPEEETPAPQQPTSYAPAGSGLGTAYAAIGSPYVYGAAGPSSFDCSGLVCYAYGYARGRTTYDMISSLKSTGSWKNSMSELSAGDLIFTDQGHVGIYIGSGMMIHAPRPGKTVCEQVVWSCIGGGTY